jgi:hypothetical protein
VWGMRGGVSGVCVWCAVCVCVRSNEMNREVERQRIGSHAVLCRIILYYRMILAFFFSRLSLPRSR